MMTKNNNEMIFFARGRIFTLTTLTTLTSYLYYYIL